MATNTPVRAIDWLLDSDPANRWQVMRDILDDPDADVAAERAKVATEGWGARLLGLQGADGQWGRDALPASGMPAAGFPAPDVRLLLRELQGVALEELARCSKGCWSTNAPAPARSTSGRRA